jgi:hypothetical protein
MQDQQKLMIDFADYANVLIRMLNNCIKEPHNHLAVYLMQADGRARLDFIQNMEYKFVELLSVDFMRTPDEIIRQHISFRYNSMKMRLQVLQTRLHVRQSRTKLSESAEWTVDALGGHTQEVNSIVKTKNPSLLLQVLHAPAKRPTSKRRFTLLVMGSFRSLDLEAAKQHREALVTSGTRTRPPRAANSIPRPT